jgi:hypothetical protein
LLGLALAAAAGLTGADRAGMVGVARGMSLGYASVYLLTSAAAFLPALGWRGWLAHQGRIAGTLAWFAAGAMLSGQLPVDGFGPLDGLAWRCLFLGSWMAPAVATWGRRHRWGGLFDRRGRRAEA